MTRVESGAPHFEEVPSLDGEIHDNSAHSQ